MILKYPTYQYPTQWSICDYFSSCKVVDTIHTTNIFFLPKSCSLTEASTRRCLKPNCSISLRSVNKLRTCLPATIVRQVTVSVQIWESSSLFVTCLHFCLAPWYLCTCKRFFWYMLACLSISSKSHHVQFRSIIQSMLIIMIAKFRPTQGRRWRSPH